MSDRPIRGTLQSMGVVRPGGGNGGNGHDGEEPMTEAEPRSQFDTPPRGSKLVLPKDLQALPEKERWFYVHNELVAIREGQQTQEIERANRERVRKADYERRENDRDALVAGLTVQYEGLIDGNRVRDRKQQETNAKLFELLGENGHLSAKVQALDVQLARMPFTITEAAAKAVSERVGKQIDNLVERFESKLDGVKRADAETKKSLTRAQGRIALHDDRIDGLELREHAQDVRIGGVEADIGTVPHKLDHRESLRDLTPAQIKEREENAAKGTGIRGEIARVDANVVALNGKRLALMGLAAATPTGIVEIGKAFGPEWSAVAVAALAAITVVVGGVRKARQRLAEWLQARRIKVSEKKKEG